MKKNQNDTKKTKKRSKKRLNFQKETKNWEDLGCLTITSINKQSTL